MLRKTYKTIEPQRRKGHKGSYYYFLCSPLCAAQRHCAFVVRKTYKL